MNYFNYCDFPIPPNEVRQEVYTIIQESKFQNTESDLLLVTDGTVEVLPDPAWNTNIGLPLSVVRNVIPNRAIFYFLETNKLIKEWAHDCIPIRFNGINIQIIKDGNVIIPHVDEVRSIAYNFQFETGNASTCFYKPKDESLIVSPQTYIPYNMIYKVFEVTIEPNKWHTINVSKIHSVENITGTRVGLSLSVVHD
jgi:hypothetical protein